MNAIAFSLFGKLPMYCHGAVRNADLIKEIYPGWQMVIWVDGTVPKETQLELDQKGAIVKQADPKAIGNGMFWRFLINDEPDVERYIVRDCDSRLNLREKLAVDAWIESDHVFHIMRDHPHHKVPILGGLWGCKGGVIKNMKGLIESYKPAKMPYTREGAYSIDQHFLARFILPQVRHSVLQHDSCTARHFPGSVPFPTGTPAGDWRFVGEIFSADDQPDPVNWQQRVNWMQFAER